MNQAVVLEKPYAAGFTEKNIPVPGSGEILLQVKFVGLCGTDLSSYRGKMPLVSYPRVPGHETGAIILEKGDRVPDHFRIGDTVTINPYTSCGRCAACQQKRYYACQYNQTLGVQRDGTLQHFISVPHEKIIKSDQLDARTIALTEPLCVSMHAVERAGVKETDTVLVMGCGMIGTGVILDCLQKGAKVIALDTHVDKLTRVSAFGPVHTILADDEKEASQIAELTNEKGPDVVFEAAGSIATYEKALSFASYGGRIVTIGYASENIRWDSSLIVRKELNILGSRNALNEFPKVVEMLEKKSFDVDLLISGTYPFRDTPSAFAYWDQHPDKVMKLLIELT